MGFFDYRCMLSGVSLCASRTALVVLEKVEDRYVPIALPVFGQYNRCGGIDMIREDELTDRLLAFFQSTIRAGAATVDWGEVYWQGALLTELTTIEQLIAAIERGVTMEYDCVTLNNRRIVFGLIDLCMWDALSYSTLETAAETERSDTWKAIYAFPVAGFGESVRELNQVEHFMKRQGISWAPPRDPEQHSSEETIRYLERATIRFVDEPLLLQGIAAYKEALDDD
jgi:hypothetical protein